MPLRVVFCFREKVDVPVEVRRLRPDVIAKLESLDVIKQLPVWVGNRRLAVADIFDVVIEGEHTRNPAEITVVFEGSSTHRLRYVGYRMEAGRIEVRGSVGPLAGYRMRGGELVIYGNADHYLGAKMCDGRIEVFGYAGSFVGGKLIGEKYGSGMKGGTIIIHGDAGSFIGHGMKRGDIIVEGSAGNFVGYGMQGGNIVIMGNAGLYPGARMSGGRIVIRGRVEDVLPSFYLDDVVKGVKVKNIVLQERYAVFIGDVLMETRGRLYINYDLNKHVLEELEPLIHYELRDEYE